MSDSAHITGKAACVACLRTESDGAEIHNYPNQEDTHICASCGDALGVLRQ